MAAILYGLRVDKFETIGFGGGCHWCTEAVFQSLRGIDDVKQGFISSSPPHDSYSEAVEVRFDPTVIPLSVLIDIHLRTHSSASAHKMREKYRSAIYYYSEPQMRETQTLLEALQADFESPLVTEILPFADIKRSDAQFQNYYKSDPNKPFCRTYIDPKLALLRREYSSHYSSG